MAALTELTSEKRKALRRKAHVHTEHCYSQLMIDCAEHHAHDASCYSRRMWCPQREEPELALVLDALDVLDALQRNSEQELSEWRKHQEICSGDDNDTPTELDRLNPYARSYKDNNPLPTEPAAAFIHGIRYYAGMLEDGDSWEHSLGHIESLCKDFAEAIAKRRKATEVSDGQ